MANFITHPDHSHVLGIWGTDVISVDSRDPDNPLFNIDKNKIKAELFSSRCPLGDLSGKVDFVVCFVVEDISADPAVPDIRCIGKHGGVDESQSPRPLRGIIQLPYTILGTANPALWGELMSGGVAHEVGHYWLVPGDGRIRTADGEVETPGKLKIYSALEQGLPIPPYPIIARENAHWSPYINGGNSVMDAINHARQSKTPGLGLFGFEGQYVQVECSDTSGPEIEVTGVGNVQTQGC